VAGVAAGRYSNVYLLGRSVYTTYLFPFEATAALLIIAVVGAVVLARRPPGPIESDEADTETGTETETGAAGDGAAPGHGDGDGGGPADPVAGSDPGSGSAVGAVGAAAGEETRG
jgi:hypothetical protein